MIKCISRRMCGLFVHGFGQGINEIGSEIEGDLRVDQRNRRIKRVVLCRQRDVAQVGPVGSEKHLVLSEVDPDPQGQFRSARGFSQVRGGSRGASSPKRDREPL